MIICENIKGNEADPQTARKLHEIEHRGELHTLILASEDMQRHRIRGTTEQGLECAIALPRDVSLQDGAVVHMGEDLAIVVAQWGAEADILNRVRHLMETGQVSIETGGADSD